MRTIPKSRELIFKQNTTRTDIYDQTRSKFKGFSFIRLSEPRSTFLITQGAKYVIESWDHGTKPLFSGLRLFADGLFYGDHLNAGKRVLMIVKMNPGELVVNLFNTYPRRNFQNVLSSFRETKNLGNHPEVNHLSPTEPEAGLISSTKINHYPND